MRTISFIRAGVFGAVLSFVGIAGALPESIHRIPHGTVYGCETCHPGGETKELNHLGELLQGIRHAHVAPDAWWTIMYNTDSDGDGLTNGEELGDPCGDWVLGSAQPSVQTVSNPGDEESRVELDGAPDCPPLPVADDPRGGAGPEPGIATPNLSVAETACAFSPGRGAGSAGASLTGAMLGLSILLRRRRPRSPARGARAGG